MLIALRIRSEAVLRMACERMFYPSYHRLVSVSRLLTPLEKHNRAMLMAVLNKPMAAENEIWAARKADFVYICGDDLAGGAIRRGLQHKRFLKADVHDAAQLEQQHNDDGRQNAGAARYSG